MKKVGLIILAAGKASRMGKPKQLLDFQGNSFVYRAAKAGLNSVCQPVVVVLGAYLEQVIPQIEKLPIQIVENHNWETGMSASIRAGIVTIIKTNPSLDGVIIALADQPLISEINFNRLVASFQHTENLIIASAYSNILGVPALFHCHLFLELMSLEGDRGAKALMRKYQQKLSSISMPEAGIDIDTQDDYEYLLKCFE